MTRSGVRSRAQSPASARCAEAAVTTSQPQPRSSPPVLSSTNASSSITTTSLPLIEPGAAWMEALGSAVKACAATKGTTTGETRALPHGRRQLDLMVEKPAQAIYDSEPQSHPAPPLMLGVGELMKLREDVLVLILRNAVPAVPHL